MIFPRRLTPLVVVPLLALLGACGEDTTTPETPAAGESQCSYTEGGEAAKKAELPPANPAEDAPEEITISTDRGDVKISLSPGDAPCTVNSFLSLAKQDYYAGTTCHRLTTEGLFVLQCGDPSATGTGGPGYSFGDELVENDARLQPCLGQFDQNGREVCTYTAGTVAMANSGPDTNGSQFFLVYKDSPLPVAYTVFGKMSAAGLKVVQSIAEGGNAADGVAPKEPVTITDVK